MLVLNLAAQAYKACFAQTEAKNYFKNQLENSTDMSVASARFPTMSCSAHMYYLDSDHKPHLPRNVKSGGRIDSRLAHIGEVVTDGHRNLQNI